MNFGAFAGGLGAGVEHGLRIGGKLNDLVKQQKVRELIQEGLAQKEAADAAQQSAGKAKVEEGPATAGQPYQSASGAVVTPVPMPGASAEQAAPQAAPAVVNPSTDEGQGINGLFMQGQGAMPPSVSGQTPAPIAQPTPATAAAGGVQAAKYYNGEKAFDTRAAAEESATGKIVSKEQHMVKSIYPKVRDYYISQGDMEKADAWDKYATSQAGKLAMKDWAKAWTAPDFDTAAARFGEYYTNHINDGVDYVGHKMLTKADGTQVATVTLKDKASGKENQIELTKESMLAMGGSANPQHLFETELAQQKEIRLAKIRMAVQAAHDAALLKLDQKKQDRIDDRADARDDARTERDAKNIRLKASLDTAVEKYKKTTDPSERAALIRKDMRENRDFQKMSKDEQDNFVLDEISRNNKIGQTARGKGGDSEEPTAKAVKVSKTPMAQDPKLPIKFKGAEAYHQMPDGSYTPISNYTPPAKKPTPAGAAAAGVSPSVQQIMDIEGRGRAR